MKLFIGIAICLCFFGLEARVFTTPEEVLKEAFPEATIDKKRIYLSSEDVEIFKKKLNFKIKHRFYSFYIAKKNQEIQGYGILHTDTVRTKEMSLMILLNKDKELSKFYLISFYEPLEYKPNDRWMNLWLQKPKEKLVLGIDVPVISGATLTSRTVSQFVELTRELVKYLN
ncbi:MAG: hypothetical protein ACK4UJ_11560 [Leptonema sp. (in: bacteria)]